ncbi:hypothetical protein [Leptospira noguchii]
MSHFNYKICERFAPIFLRRTHVKLRACPKTQRFLRDNSLEIFNKL